MIMIAVLVSHFISTELFCFSVITITVRNTRFTSCTLHVLELELLEKTLYSVFINNIYCLLPL